MDTWTREMNSYHVILVEFWDQGVQCGNTPQDTSPSQDNMDTHIHMLIHN